MGQDSTPEECHDLFVTLLSLGFLFVHLFCFVFQKLSLKVFNLLWVSLASCNFSGPDKIPAVYSRLTLCVNAKVALWLRSTTLFFLVFYLWDWWLKQLLAQPWPKRQILSPLWENLLWSLSFSSLSENFPAEIWRDDEFETAETLPVFVFIAYLGLFFSICNYIFILEEGLLLFVFVFCFCFCFYISSTLFSFPVPIARAEKQKGYSLGLGAKVHFSLLWLKSILL